MPTLGEACQQLRIGRVTLEKWIKRLGIETTRHEWDYRYQLIAPEDVERIAEARRKLPSAIRSSAFTGAPILPTYTGNALRAKSDGSGGNEASPTIAPMPRPRPLQVGASSPLPDGMMSKQDAADAHGVPLSTLRRWCDDGRIETDSGSYGGEHGHYAVSRPLTVRGLAQLYALAHRRSDFTRCPACPHTEP